MVAVQISAVCRRCKIEFEITKTFTDGLEADLFRAELSERPPLCSNCIRKEMRSRSEARAQALHLPRIYGNSDKQAEFAFSLRDKYVRSHMNDINRARYELSLIDPSLIPEAASRNHMSQEAYIEQAFRCIDLFLEYLCLVEGSASRLIEYLK